MLKLAADLSAFSSIIEYSGDVIFVKPVCDFFQIDYKTQCKVIATDTILSREMVKKKDKSLFHDERSRVTLSKKGFTRWIELINPQIVRTSQKDQLLKYQSMVFDVIFGSMEQEHYIKQEYASMIMLIEQRKEILVRINKHRQNIINLSDIEQTSVAV